MRKKKEIPLAILKALEGFVNLKGEKFDVVDPKSCLLKVVDKDSESEFHFSILDYKKSPNGVFQFYMQRSPKNQNEPKEYQTWVDVSSLQAQFNTWIELLQQYEATSSFFDDPILNSFSDEFYAEFEIIDEDAQTKPLNTKQILLLDEYLESVELKIDEFKNEKNSEDIQDIKSDIIFLKENLTTKPKAWVMKKLSRIWGKMAKQGVVFIKEFLAESKKEAIKQGVKFIVEYVAENAHTLLK